MPKKLGRYEIIRELGKGAMGVIYEGRDPTLERRVAIKTARREVMERSGQAEEIVERFVREARAAGALNHPNIVTIYDVGEEGGTAYIAMEYIEGSDLKTLIEQNKAREINEVVEWGVQICEALACAHDQGIFHRDVKPANIMIPNQGVLKVTDFGIARTHDSTLTQEGALIGTPSYMSPEQFMGKKVDARSDLFSLAIILYELLTGEKPFAGEALTTIMHHVLKSEPAPPHELNYEVPEALSAVIMKALSKRPQDRYGDGRSMALALRESLQKSPDMSIVLAAGIAAAETVLDAASGQRTPAPSSSTLTGAQAAPVADAATVAGKAQPAATVISSSARGAPDSGNIDSLCDEADTSPDRNVARFTTRQLLMLIGVMAVLCLAMGVGAYLLASVLSRAPDEAVNATATELINIGVHAYVTADGQVRSAFDELKQQEEPGLMAWIDEQEDQGLMWLLLTSGYEVQASNPNSGEVYDSKSLVSGYAYISIPKDAPRVYFEVLHEGVQYDAVTIEAPYWQEWPVLVLYDPDAARE